MKAAFTLNTSAAIFQPWLVETLTRILDAGIEHLIPERLEVAFQDLHEYRYWTHFVSDEEHQAMLHDNNYDWGTYWTFWERPHYWRACNNRRIYHIISLDWGDSNLSGEVELYTTLTKGHKKHGSNTGSRRLLKPCVRFAFAQVEDSLNLLIDYDENPFGYDFSYTRRREWKSTIEPEGYFLDELAAALNQFNPVWEAPRPKPPEFKPNKLANRIGKERPAKEAQVKVRIEGLPADVALFAAVLRGLVDVLEESSDQPNQNNSRFIRRYLEMRLDNIKAADLLSGDLPEGFDGDQGS